MIKNFLKVCFRNMKRNKAFTTLNILGLAIGLSASILILLYVTHEKGYDRFHTDADRIHRVTMSFKNGDTFTTTTTSTYIIGPLLAESVPQVESFFRMTYEFNSRRQLIFGEKKFDITKQYTFTDPNFFDFWSFKMIEGDPRTALSEPLSMVIAASEAKKLFGNVSPMGQTLTIRSVYRDTSFDVKVTGVMEDIPSQSHFHYKYLISMQTATDRAPGMAESWGWTSQNTYIKLKPGASTVGLREKIKEEVVNVHAPDWFREWAYFDTQPLLDIHLRSQLKEELEPPGDATYVRLLMIIAIFLIAIASINYMNLATSLATKRAREIGVKKAVGARRRHLTLQFLMESVITVLLSGILAITILQLVMPVFNSVVGAGINLFALPAGTLIIGFLSIIALGILSGIYPAFFLSSIRPLKTLAGETYKLGVGSLTMRKGLVIIQFAISSFLICATLIILSQWHYLRNRALGLDTDEIVAIRLPSAEAVENYPLLRQQLLDRSDVSAVSACSKSPTGRYDGFTSLSYNGEGFSIPQESVDENFFDTFGITFETGRNFSTDNVADSNAIIINRKTLDVLGLERPLETPIKLSGKDVHIVGVVEDFHFEPLYAELGPVVFVLNESWISYAYTKINISNLERTLSDIQSIWTTINPKDDFSFVFVNDEIQEAYRSEQQFFWIFTLFSSLAIFVACLGLFGLAGFTVSQKIKEIGIRKALGASSASIVLMLSKKFTLLVVIANLLAWPIAYWIMGAWLEKFPYRIDIGIWIFLLTGVLSLIIAWVSVSSNSIKASMVNPVNSLRYE